MTSLPTLEACLAKTDRDINAAEQAYNQAREACTVAKVQMKADYRAASSLRQQLTRQQDPTEQALLQVESKYDAAKQAYEQQHELMWKAKSELFTALRAHTEAYRMIESVLTKAVFRRWERERWAMIKREEASPAPASDAVVVSPPVAAKPPRIESQSVPSPQLETEPGGDDCECEECEAAFFAPRPT